MTTTFRFLKLPYIAQKIIVQNMDIFELVDLSMRSSVFHRLLQHIKRSLWYCTFTLNRGNTSLDFMCTTGDYIINVVKASEENEPNVKINGCKMSIEHPKRFRDRKSIYIRSTKNEEEVMEQLVEHFLSFFKVKKFDLSTHNDYNFTNSFLWKYTKKFESITYGELSKGSIYIVAPYKFVKLLLNDIKSETLCFNVRVLNIPTGIVCKSQHVKFEKPEFGIYEQLHRLNVKILSCNVFGNVSGTVNLILKEWIDGKFDKLEMLTLKAEHKWSQDPRLCFRGITAMESAFTLKELFKAVRSIVEKGYDIRRKSDDQLASVTFNSDCVKMIVWSEKRIREARQMVANNGF